MSKLKRKKKKKLNKPVPIMVDKTHKTTKLSATTTQDKHIIPARNPTHPRNVNAFNVPT